MRNYCNTALLQHFRLSAAAAELGRLTHTHDAQARNAVLLDEGRRGPPGADIR